MALEVGVPTNPYHDPTGSLEGSRDTEEGIVVSTQPDICLTPNGAAMVAVGYNIWAKQADDARTTPTVKLTSLRSHNMGSFITTCHGDEAGVGGGTKSGTHNGICEPKEHSATVFSEGKQMIRHTDEWWMNNRNTVGKLIYVKDADAYGRWWEKQTGKVQLALLDTGVKSDASGFTASAPELSEAEIAAQTRAAETELAEGAAELAASTGLQEVAAGEAEGGLAGSEFGPLEWIGAGALAGGTEAYALYLRRQANKKMAEATAKLALLAALAIAQKKSVVRVTGEEDDPKKCCIASHKVNKGPTGACKACKPGQNAQSHHGMIDYPFRTGTQRSEGHIAPGSPGREDALTVCVPGPSDESDENEHGDLHSGGLDAAVKASGQNGLTTFEAVRKASFDGIDRISDTTLSPACKALYKRLLDAQFTTPPNMKLRANPSPLPGPENDVGQALSQAWGFKW